MAIFPAADTEEQFETVDEAQLQAGVAELLDRLGETGAVERFEDGSLPVYAVGPNLVLKLFPPVFVAETTTESTVLEALDGKLPVPTPQVVQTGEVDGWGYVLMTRLAGRPLSETWDELAEAEQVALVAELGRLLAAVHATPPPADLGPDSWDAFVTEQTATAVARQIAAGLGDQWLAQIPGFLSSVDLGTAAPVFLHTEFMRHHVMVSQAGRDQERGAWQCTGLFDFEPAMVGAAEYDLVGVGIFVTGGDHALFREFLLAYGYSAADLDGNFAERCLAYTLLHKYSNLPWYFKVLGEPAEPTLKALARHWFGTD